MKRPSDDLFRLIKSLTKSEKRAFRLSASSNKNATKYIAIFDAIDAQTVYDEAALKHKFRNEKWVNRFNAAKDYVYNLLLDNLAIHSQKNKTSYQLHDLIMHIRVLQSKGFYNRSLKLLEKGKRMAAETDDYVSLLELLGLENVNHVSGVNADNNELVWAQQKEILTWLENEYSYNQLYKMAYELLHRNGSREKKLEDWSVLMKSDLLLDIKSALTFSAKRQFLTVHYLFAFSQGKSIELQQWILKINALFEANPGCIISQPVNYTYMLLNLHDSYLHQKQFKNAFLTIEKLQSFCPTEMLKEHERLTYLIEYGAVYCEIATLNALGRFDESQKKMVLLFSLFKNHQLHISPNIINRHHYLLAKLFFGLGQFKKSQQALGEIIKKGMHAQRGDLIRKSYILLFLVYYELGKIELLTYNIRSVKRLMQLSGSLNELEQALFKLVSQLLNGFNDKELVRQDLNLVKQVRESGDYVPSYIEISDWVESKLENLTYAEFLSLKYDLQSLKKSETIN